MKFLQGFVAVITVLGTMTSYINYPSRTYGLSVYSEIRTTPQPAELQLPSVKTNTYELLDEQEFLALRYNEPTQTIKAASNNAYYPQAEEAKDPEISMYIETHVDQKWKSWFQNIIWCESRYDINARSVTDSKGLMQFTDSTFAAYGGRNIWDWKEQIDVAQQMLRQDPANIYQWDCSPIMGY